MELGKSEDRLVKQKSIPKIQQWAVSEQEKALQINMDEDA